MCADKIFSTELAQEVAEGDYRESFKWLKLFLTLSSIIIFQYELRPLSMAVLYRQIQGDEYVFELRKKEDKQKLQIIIGSLLVIGKVQ